MSGEHEFESLRFRYEYGHESVQSLCAEYGYLIKEVEAYIKLNDWEAQDDPDLMNANTVNKYYSLARRRLTVATVKRALATWNRLTELEDILLDKSLTALSNITDLTHQPGMELSRISKIVQTIQAANQMYGEAVIVPAITDRDLKSLLDKGSARDINALMELMKDRGIPIPKVNVEDLESDE